MPKEFLLKFVTADYEDFETDRDPKHLIGFLFHPINCVEVFTIIAEIVLFKKDSTLKTCSGFICTIIELCVKESII